MKLLELIGVKKFHDSTVDEVLDSMSKNFGGEYEETGRGSFGVALKHTSKPQVVKFWITDSSYDDFINYVAAHPSKHLPKLYSKPKQLSAFFLRPKDFPDKVRYVKMEQLHRIDSEHEAEVVDRIFKHLRDCNSTADVDKYLEELIVENEEAGGEDSRFSTIGILKKKNVNIKEFVHDMFDMLRHVLRGKNALDIHTENIMQRSNGDLVITDPVYNTTDYYDSDKIRTALFHLKKEEAIKGRSKTPKKEPE